MITLKAEILEIYPDVVELLVCTCESKDKDKYNTVCKLYWKRELAHIVGNATGYPEHEKRFVQLAIARVNGRLQRTFTALPYSTKLAELFTKPDYSSDINVEDLYN